jgi:hypothetical protein
LPADHYCQIHSFLTKFFYHEEREVLIDLTPFLCALRVLRGESLVAASRATPSAPLPETVPFDGFWLRAPRCDLYSAIHQNHPFAEKFGRGMMGRGIILKALPLIPLSIIPPPFLWLRLAALRPLRLCTNKFFSVSFGCGRRAVLSVISKLRDIALAFRRGFAHIDFRFGGCAYGGIGRHATLRW